MREYTILWFDRNQRYSHYTIAPMPGTDVGGVRSYILNNWASPVMGVETVYAVAMCTDGAEPVLVVKPSV